MSTKLWRAGALEAARWSRWSIFRSPMTMCYYSNGSSSRSSYCNGELRVFVVAGEPSGDVIGARLMASLKTVYSSNIKFCGVGGALMEKQGLVSEFSMDDLSVMGAVELLPHLLRLRARLQQTVATALCFQPHIVVAIDSKGFSYRVFKRLQDKCRELQSKPMNVLYVAPSAWAWKDGEKRLKKWVGVVDHILCVLPFEESFCKSSGLAATFVGHPVLEDVFSTNVNDKLCVKSWKIDGDHEAFYSKHSLPKGSTLMSLLPGSRLQEVKRMMPIYGEVVDILKVQKIDLTVTIPTTSNMELIRMVEKSIQKWDVRVVLLAAASLEEKYEAFTASDVGLCTSGTAVLQMQLARLPCVAAYRANIVTEWLVKRAIQLKYMSLTNILLDSPIIPEAVFSECTSDRLAKMITDILEDERLQKEQVLAAERVFEMLCPSKHGFPISEDNKPSILAAKKILSLVRKK